MLVDTNIWLIAADHRAPRHAEIVELLGTYADLALDLVDASLIAIAERVGENQIATLNYRDFTVVRPAHIDAVEVLPGPA